MDYKSLSLPGSMITGVVSMVSLCLLTLFLCFLIYGIWMRMELNGFFRDVGPIALISAAIWYLCFSFRIVISRNQDSVITHRQFLAPQIQYLRREYSVDSLTVDQVTHSDPENGNSTTYTTLYSGEEVIVEYIGHKRKLKHVLPELMSFSPPFQRLLYVRASVRPFFSASSSRNRDLCSALKHLG